MPDREMTCEACQATFVYAEAEQARDYEMGYPAPRCCLPCLRQRRAAGAAARAAKRPRKRYFRR